MRSDTKNQSVIFCEMDKSSMMVAEIKSGGVKCYLWKENIVSVRGREHCTP